MVDGPRSHQRDGPAVRERIDRLREDGSEPLRVERVLQEDRDREALVKVSLRRLARHRYAGCHTEPAHDASNAFAADEASAAPAAPLPTHQDLDERATTSGVGVIQRR